MRNMAKFIVIFICIVCKLCKCTNEVPQLKHVHIIYRHGDRAPINIYPTDKNEEDKWPHGFSQLTDKGINQHFNLGKWLRKRYNKFLGNYLNYSAIYVRSTDVDRTLMSAQSNLAGLFYNSTEDVIKGLKWHPIPIHTVRTKSDILLQGDNCPAYMAYRNKFYQTDYFVKKLEPYQSFLEFLRDKTGNPKLLFMDVWKIYDTIYCEKEHNLTISDWITDEVWNKILTINDINWEIMNYDKLPKLTGGYMLNKIVSNLESFSKNELLKVKGSKLIIYSGHDTDVAPLASLFGIFSNKQPPYTACILIELYYLPSKSEKWAVQVVYKNYTDSSGTVDIPPAIIRGCNTTLCPLSRFMEVTKSKILSKQEYNDICYPKQDFLFAVQIMFAVVSVCVILFIIIVFFCQTYRKSRSHTYSRVDTRSNVN